ncbi:cation-independent mannose-6-phosphate receptor-like [Argonauta hians]
MAWTRFCVSLLAAVFTHGIYVLGDDTSSKDCKIGTYDFSQLDLSYPWTSVSPSNDTYWISICTEVTHSRCPAGTSVCRENSGVFTSVGRYESPPKFVENEDKEIIVSYIGGTCPSNSSVSQRTDIIFKCGKTLGSPNFLSEDEACTAVFEWESVVACKKRPEKAVKEVPCYVYVMGKKRDLSPLIKLKGGYDLVDSNNSTQHYLINLCRAITQDPSKPFHCSEDSASCGKIKDELIDFGEPVTALRAIDNRTLQLVYSSGSQVKGCSTTPETVLTFICPASSRESRSPVVTQKNCLLEVDWITQYACEESAIFEKNSLKLTREKDNIDFDLSPLAKKSYNVSANINGHSEYSYILSLGRSIPCKNDDKDDKYHPSVCQLKPGDDNFSKILGSVQHSTLRYSDGHLTLTFKEGQRCSSNFKRKTIIEFYCNKTAVNSQPVYSYEEYCSYFFEWSTPHACLDHPLQQKCSTVYNNKLFDLSSLIYTSENWVAMNGHKYNDGALVIINVCHDIIPGDKASNCPTDSSICLKTLRGNTKSLGRYQQEPVFNPVTRTLQLNYTDGDQCENGHIFTVITFFCAPGITDSPPVLVTKSPNDCSYYVEWHTAAACVLTKKTGADCQVEDETSGISFNLNPLRKLKDSYEIKNGKYSYFLNVCDNVHSDSCKVESQAGVCQTDNTQDVSKNAGHGNSALIYENGMLKLIYQNGDAYNSKPPTPRSSVITFVCDTKASPGRPEFIEETNSTYWFLWYTKFACVASPVECTFTDENTHQQYDLSSLSQTSDNWIISGKNSSQKFYINVCRPLNHIPVGKGCDFHSSVCSTKFVNGKEELEHENLGEAVRGPVKRGDNLILQYTSNKACWNSENKLTNYSTTIHFQCVKETTVRGPTLLDVISKCEYVFLWRTSAACVETSTESKQEKCTVKDPNTGYTYNLQPLIRTGSGTYLVESQTHKFYINICAPVKIPDCIMPDKSEPSVCEFNSNTVTGLASVNTELELTDGHLQLSYHGQHRNPGSRFRITIIFVCAVEGDLGTMRLVRQSEHDYIFQFDTALACAPHPVDCIVQDRLGNEYDLSQLTKQAGNWQVRDGSTRYIINICSPVNHFSGNSTCAGLVGGCQIAPGRGAYNMGYIQGKPIALPDGSLSIRYRNGDLCHKGKDTESHRSTRINFYCSTDEHHLSFEGETEFCEYVFSWKTPAACPSKRIKGSSCKVTDPLYKDEFDLSPLRKLTGNYEVPGDGYNFLLNVCGTLNTDLDSCGDGTAACQTRSSDSSFVVDIGKSSDELVYEDGVLFLTYKGGKSNCHKKFTRKTLITFTCDSSVDGTAGPHYLEEKFDCTYLFEWPTKYACSHVSVSDCTMQDNKGNDYDFSGLTLTSDNYVFVESKLTNRKFILNICQTLVHQKGQTCPSNSAACLIDMEETDLTKKYHSIGQLSDKPLQLDNNHLQLVYKNGEPCKGSGANSSSTYIMFQCDLTAVDTSPSSYYFVERNCEHHFLWLTREACPLTNKTSSHNNCRVTDQATGITFDLSRLRKSQGYTVSDQKEHSFQLNICGNVEQNSCSKKSGSCQTNVLTNRSFNSGNANSILHYKNGIVFLNYTGGDKCHQGKFERNTIINFVCNPSIGTGVPVYLAESEECTYYFSWHTNLVCEKQVRCTVTKGNHLFDLSPLVNMSANHIAEAVVPSRDPGATYYINICRPLNPIFGAICPPFASVCATNIGQKDVNLGSVSEGLFIDPNDHTVTIHYKHGDPCPNTNQNRSTIIKFRCKIGPSLGHPVLMDAIDSCSYIFNWETNLVCEESQPHPAKNCVYNDTRTLIQYDFTPLYNTGEHKIPVSPSATFHLRVCGPVIGVSGTCSSAGSCYVDASNREVNFGQADGAVFSVERDLVTLTYQDGKLCPAQPGVHMTTKILFLCNINAALGEPVLFEQNPCQVVFLWKTRLACPPVVKDCFLSYLNNSYDLSSLANTQSWKAHTFTGEVYWINVCQSLFTRPKSRNCSGAAAICVEKGNQVKSIGSVSRSVLYVDRKSPVNHPVIILQYSSDTNICGNKRAKTIIRFSCSKTIGMPKFSKHDPESCTYEFTWATHLACKEDRETLKEVNGVLIDSQSSGRIYFGNRTKGKTFYIEETKGIEKFYYDINFEGHLYTNDNSEGSKNCRNAAVCQRKKGDSTYYKNLGSANKKRFYMDVSYMDLEITSPEKCQSNPSKNIVSVFEFMCTHLASMPNPVFMYESSECVFLFYWHSNISCLYYDHNGNNDKKPEVHKASSNYNVAVPVISIIVAIIVIVVLLKILMKPEQKQIMKEKLRNFFTRNRTVKARYINVPQIDDNDDDEGLLVMEDGHNITTYHDDSDEDMIL